MVKVSKNHPQIGFVRWGGKSVKKRWWDAGCVIISRNIYALFSLQSGLVVGAGLSCQEHLVFISGHSRLSWASTGARVTRVKSGSKGQILGKVMWRQSDSCPCWAFGFLLEPYWIYRYFRTKLEKLWTEPLVNLGWIRIWWIIIVR